MKHQLIKIKPLERVSKPVGGFPAVREVAEGQEIMTPEGHAYVPLLERPDAPEGKRVVRRLTAESDGWELIDTDEPSSTTISALSEAFKKSIPEDFQSDPLLLTIFATVNVLLNANEPEMAATFIQNSVVPNELEALKLSFISIIDRDQSSAG